MDSELKYIGAIIYYDRKKHYGFIDSATYSNIYFSMDSYSIPAEEKYKQLIFEGDEVKFKIRQSEVGEMGIVAYDLERIKNEKVDHLFKSLEENKQLVGFLKKINEEYYVKDIATYLLIPLQISTWEKDIEDLYEGRINQQINYQILTRPTKLRAVLVDRRYSDIYFILHDYLRTASRIPANITGRNTQGYFATILEGAVDVFIKFDKEGTVPNDFQKGDCKEIIITAIYEKSLKVQLV